MSFDIPLTGWTNQGGAHWNGGVLTLPTKDSSSLSPPLESLPRDTNLLLMFDYEVDYTGAAPVAFRVGSHVPPVTGTGGCTFWPAQPNTTQHSSLGFRANTGALQLIITRPFSLSPSESGSVEIRDLQFIEQPSGPFDYSPYPKKVFDAPGARLTTRSDNLWLLDGEPWVPIGIYADYQRTSWDMYAPKGFNFVMWCTNLYQVQKATDGELLSFFDITPWVKRGSWGGQNYDYLHRSIDEILNSSVGNNLLAFYMDDEAWDQYDDIVAPCRELRRRYPHLPFYFLEGNYGRACNYAHNDILDMTGTYINDPSHQGGNNLVDAGLVSLHTSTFQSATVSIAQVNYRNAGILDQVLEYCERGTATGWAHWRDGAQMGPVESAEWWGDLQNRNADITAAVLDLHESVPEPPPPPIEPPPGVLPGAGKYRVKLSDITFTMEIEKIG